MACHHAKCINEIVNIERLKSLFWLNMAASTCLFMYVSLLIDECLHADNMHAGKISLNLL